MHDFKVCVATWIPASAGMTVCEAQGQWDSVGCTIFVWPHRRMPLNTRIPVWWRVLDTRLCGYDGAGYIWAIGAHGSPYDPHRVIPAKAGIQDLHNLIPKVVPMWIVFFNKTELPRSAPFLKLFFSRNR